MSASRSFPSLPRLAPHGGRREEDDGLDALETPEAAAARLQDGYRAATPSVVIAPDAQVAPPPEPRLKRGGQEATLVIRDRRRVDSIRAEMRRRASVGERYRSFLLWTGAGLGAFALGVGVVAALGQRSGQATAESSPDASALSVAQGSEAQKGDSVPVPRAPVVVAAAPVQAPPAVSAPTLATEKAPANERAATPPVAREVSPAASSPADGKTVPAEGASAKRPSNVVSLDELPGE